MLRPFAFYLAQMKSFPLLVTAAVEADIHAFFTF